MKKGSMELGVNSIVVLIIAMAVLGLIIYFIYDKLSNPEIPPLPVDHAKSPSAAEPITISPIVLQGGAGDEIQAYVAVFNNLGNDSSDAGIDLVCGDSTHNIEASLKDIPSFDYVEYTTILTYPRMTSGKHICSITAKGTVNGVADTEIASQEFVVEIK